jgi:hypothetical protein
MKWLARIPFWVWLLILTVFCYLVWNPMKPDWSLVGLLKGDAQTSVKVLVSLLAFTVFGIFSNATYRALGRTGLIIYIAIIGALLWVLKDQNVIRKDNANVLVNFIPFFVALLLAIGSQSSKVYRAITGRVSVEDPDTHSTDHDQDQQDVDL